MTGLAKALMGVGLMLLVAGALVWLGQYLPPGLRPGRLPGDIAIRRDGFRFYFPITTMILLSVLLTALMWLFRWWRG